MKKMLPLLFIAFLPVCLLAQKEGQVKYKEITKLDIKLPEGTGISEEQLRAMIPSEQTAEKVLYFNQDATLYTALNNTDDADQEFNMQDGGSRIVVRTVSTGGDAKTYHNLKTHQITEQKDFLGRMFLVAGSAKDQKWKLTGATREVAGYPCQQATTEKDDRMIEVWFTPAIPIPAGPDGFANLPGLVLEALITSENSERRLVAQEVRFNAPEAGLIAPPKKGKKVTPAEFDQIVEEKTKEMSQGGGMRIRIGG